MFVIGTLIWVPFLQSASLLKSLLLIWRSVIGIINLPTKDLHMGRSNLKRGCPHRSLSNGHQWDFPCSRQWCFARLILESIKRSYMLDTFENWSRLFRSDSHAMSNIYAFSFSQVMMRNWNILPVAFNCVSLCRIGVWNPPLTNSRLTHSLMNLCWKPYDIFSHVFINQRTDAGSLTRKGMFIIKVDTKVVGGLATQGARPPAVIVFTAIDRSITVSAPTVLNPSRVKIPAIWLLGLAGTYWLPSTPDSGYNAVK